MDVAATGTTFYVIDASGEKAALIFQCPKSGTLDRFEACIAVVTNTPDNGLRFSFQDVVLTSGQPDGVVDQFATVASGSVAVGWLNPGNFDATRVVTKGQLLAAVLDFPTFVASDSIAIRSWDASASNLPYGIATVTSKQQIHLPVIAIHYTDGTYGYIPSLPAVLSVATESYASNNVTADEYGLKLTPTVDCKLSDIRARLTVGTGTDFDLVVYDSANTVLESTPFEGFAFGTTTALIAYLALETEVVLAAGSTYRIIIKPTTTTAIGLQYLTFQSLDLLEDTVDLPAGSCLTRRVDAGAWTDFNNVTDGYRLPFMNLRLSAFDDGAGSVSGGGSRNRIQRGM